MSKAAITALALVAFAVTTAVALALWAQRTDDPATIASRGSGLSTETPPAVRGGGGLNGDRGIGQGPKPIEPGPFAVSAGAAGAQLVVGFKHPPRAGLLFDVDTGEVLWKRAAGRRMPIASLTKMMTALLVAEGDRLTERVRITRQAAETGGSKLGLLRPGERIRLKPLFYALIMESANDAAVALAQHDAGKVHRFVARMNRRARRLGLRCTHFANPSGLKNRHNHSCPLDLAALARADLANRLIARVAATRRIFFRFPVKGGRIELYNNHYFLQRGIAGLPNARVTGLKTGYTIAAGSCYVTTARLGGRELGVILLDTPDPLKQVPRLLRAGFADESALS
jgi:D-alanyl-D-alanine carboxypeptidase (penicillin-binding protein 5/6)